MKRTAFDWLTFMVGLTVGAGLVGILTHITDALT